MKLKKAVAIFLMLLYLFSLVSCKSSPNTDQTTTTAWQEYTQPKKTGLAVSGAGVYNNVSYSLYIPSSYKVTESVPMLVALHGGGQGSIGDAKDNPQFFADYTGLNTVAEKYGFIVVYPRQATANNYGYDYWNWFNQQSKTSKEPTAIYNIVSEVKNSYNIDSSQVFICGLSAGAAMAQIVAVTYSSTFAGCCAVAGIPFKSGSLNDTNALQASGPVFTNDAITLNIYNNLESNKSTSKLLVITGTADTRVHPRNSLVMAQTWASAMKMIDNSVDSELKSETATGINGIDYNKSVYAMKNGEELCTLYEVVGMGHNWPGSNYGVSISITSGQDLGYKGGIDLNEVMCEFFGLNK